MGCQILNLALKSDIFGSLRSLCRAGNQNMNRKQLSFTSAGILFATALFGFSVLNPVAVKSVYASCSSTAGPGVDWEGCRKRNLIMTGSDFSGSNFSKADLSSSDLRKANLTGSNLAKANLFRASLAGAKASGANFAGVVAYRTNFSKIDFTDANFNKAEIFRSEFSGSIIRSADMSKGEFSRVDFSGAQIGDTNFDYSNLARSDFRGTDLTAPISMKGTYLFRTRFEGVDISLISGLEAWQLSMACGNAATKLPDGMSRPNTWPCVEETR